MNEQRAVYLKLSKIARAARALVQKQALFLKMQKHEILSHIADLDSHFAKRFWLLLTKITECAAAIWYSIKDTFSTVSEIKSRGGFMGYRLISICSVFTKLLQEIQQLLGHTCKWKIKHI